MITLNNTLTAQQIRSLNINEMDLMSFEYIYDNDRENNYLLVNEVRVANFDSSKNRKKSFDKIKKMGLGLGWQAPQLTDEESGIIQAGLNNENPFAYTIMCADPTRNEIVR